MPLDDLVSVIETLKARLHTHRQVLEANETRTRMALIDPLLQALGWDTADPALVQPEYEVSGRQAADYALMDTTDNPIALVEAKRLGESLASHRMQIVNYANLSGVPYAGLTDGNHWELYKVFDPAPIDDRLLLNLSIADRPGHEVALKLLLLWRPNLAAGQPVGANEPVLTRVLEPVTPQPAAGPEVDRHPPLPPEQPPESPPAAAGWVPLSEVASVTGRPPPAAISFPGGSTCEVKVRWRLLQAVVEWLWSKEKLTMSDIPVKLTENRYLVNADDKHPTGKRFEQPRQIDFDGTRLMFEAKTGSKEAVSKAKRLLQERGVSLEEVRLQFEED